MRNIQKTFKYIIPTLRHGGVGVIPTDTIYGLAGLALDERTVARVYKLRRRNPKKPFIILIGSYSDLKKFGVAEPHLSFLISHFLRKLWPKKVSVVLPCRSEKFTYLHRGTKTLAFRYPEPKWLQTLVKKTGPLISTSANWEGKPPARTIAEAKKYFVDKVDFYVDAGRQVSKPSTVVSLQDGKLTVLRQGAVRVKRLK